MSNNTYTQQLNIPNILPHNSSTSDMDSYLPFSSPTNILTQPKSNMTTNPYINNSPDDTEIDDNILDNSPIQQSTQINTNAFISDNDKKKELSNIQQNVNKIISDNYNHNITSSISHLSISEINKNISKSCIDFMNDLLNKPNTIDWIEYIQISLRKNQRYTYIGILFMFISIFILLITNK